MSSSADANANLNPNPEVRRRTFGSTKPRINGEVAADVLINGKARRDSTAVERPRDSPEYRKRTAETPAVAHQRRRKSVTRPETPKWVTVLSVLTKLCLLVLGLTWLGKMVLQLSNSNGSMSNFPFAAMDQDGRISELESFLKKTAKMFQVQIEVVDKKFGNQIAVVRNELTKKVEEEAWFLEEELKKLEARTEELGGSLGELKDLGFLTKEEFESFSDELKKRRLYGDEISLDDIGALAREIVEKEIEKHAADGVGRPDYALASGGAKVTMHSEPFVSGKARFILGGKDRVHPNAQKMLEPSFGEPGQCFALKGSSGYVEIRLRTAIIPQAVTLEHVAKSVAYDRSSAPKDCIVSAWFDVHGESRNTQISTEFSYDLMKSNAQTFDVEKTDVGVVNMVRLDFTSNHGSPLTCIYRLRVHGNEPEGQQFGHPNSLEGEKNIG